MFLFDLTTEYRVIIGISAMVLLFSVFLISFVTSQRKKLQYHKELQLLNEKQQQVLQEQNMLLEQRVKERTIELSEQKEALQQSLTELKTTQTHLIQREKMASLGELTAGIAHEMQNPLNFVNNFSELSNDMLSELKEEIESNNLTGSLALTDELSQILQKINHHGVRASSIVRGMLEHSRAETGERQLTNLNTLADEYFRLAYQGVRTKNQSFTCDLVTDFAPNMGKVMVVPQNIGRVLLNLYNNAFYAVQEKQKMSAADFKPCVCVTTSRQNERITIQVRDNGMGIPDAISTKIFQPFFTTKPTGKGVGLGLSLSYDIITNEYGGELTVTTTPGEGTEFGIHLPSLA
ncbi:sensor histidine kinase [Fibrivirga algicola]|uniref:histidine kinase n=1 Tax=Fibrivirga algicola TaxID=2950420 RepID=A0ABX0QPK2_9BACT|nr:ATP-binding protein [Fibrivirga algicola]ARK11683.1 two-component sensor histidine kinase [Fibrella sp. ES10-3-2-2]NID13718.1 two-component sensor histidine kinase [Fibrivirga algicola]